MALMASLIREIPERDRPRERLLRLGEESLTDAEILAILLRTGRKGVSALMMGELLLKQFGSLENLARQSVSEISKVSGVGRTKAGLLKAAFDLHRRIQAQQRERPCLDHPSKVHELLFPEMCFHNVEVLMALALDSKLRLVRRFEISRGLLNQTLVHAREVFREAIAVSAAHVVLAHNHPSGDPRPSPDDIRATRELSRAGELLGIPLVDHVIIGRPSVSNPQGYVSLKELGVLGGGS
jgi:DNA repair protein RadC